MKVKPATSTGGVVMELGRAEKQIHDQAIPFHIQNVLVPVDFSECSDKALAYAVPFAKQFGATLHLVFVRQIVPAEAELGYLAYGSAEAYQRRLDELKDGIDRDVTVKTRLMVGLPDSEIITAARDAKADLIIISTHGRRGWERMFLGSTTEKVVRKAPCPVLVVRETERDFCG